MFKKIQITIKNHVKVLGFHWGVYVPGWLQTHINHLVLVSWELGLQAYVTSPPLTHTVMKKTVEEEPGVGKGGSGSERVRMGC